MDKKQPKWLYTLPFFLILGVLTVCCAIPGLRPDRSYSERRELASWPEFTWESFLSGEYFDGISTWFSDTFPGREGWMETANKINALHGSSELMISGTVPTSDEIPEDIPEETQPLEVYVPETMPPETQPPETQPEESGETQPGESETEAATEPTAWQGANAGDEAEILRGAAAFQLGDAAYVYQNFSAQTTDNFASTLNQFAEKIQDTGVKVICAPPPTAVGILIEEEYQESLSSVSQRKILDYLFSRLDDSIIQVDTVGALLPHNGEYIYFRTDHHWTPLGAYYAYAAVCDSIGIQPVELDSLETWDLGEFSGSLVSKVNRPGQLRLDDLIAYIPKGDITVSVMNVDLPYDTTILNRWEGMRKEEKYAVYGDDFPMTKVVNTDLEGGTIAVVKDSFGNCFVPFLTQNFRTVYTFDYRRYSGASLYKALDDLQPDYILVMPYIAAIESYTGPQSIYRVLIGY